MASRDLRERVGPQSKVAAVRTTTWPPGRPQRDGARLEAIVGVARRLADGRPRAASLAAGMAVFLPSSTLIQYKRKRDQEGLGVRAVCPREDAPGGRTTADAGWVRIMFKGARW